MERRKNGIEMGNKLILAQKLLENQQWGEEKMV